MFSRTKSETAAPAAPLSSKKILPSVISSDLHILGSLVTEGVVDIDGNIEGNIKGDQVTIRPNGKVKGDVVAQSVHIYGEVRGLVRASAVFLYSSSHVEGIVMHQSLSVEDGAFVDGKFKRLKDNTFLEASSADIEENEGIFEIAQPANLRLIG